jgi:hypothetical protein
MGVQSVSDLPRDPSSVLTGSLSWIVKSPFDDLWRWMSSRRAGAQPASGGTDIDSWQTNCLRTKVSSPRNKHGGEPRFETQLDSLSL